MSARPALIPGSARCDAGRLASSATSSREPVALEHVALDPVTRRALGGGREVADGAAHADEATAAVAQPVGLAELLADRDARLLEPLARDGARGGEVLLGDPDRAERPRPGLERLAARDRGQLQAAAAEVEHDAVRQRRRVHGRDEAEPRLLLRRQHADRQAGPLLCDGQQVGAVRRIADRAGGDRVDRLRRDAARQQVAAEHLERLEPAGDRVGLERAGAAEALGDPDRLLQLADPAPRGARQVGEHHEPPGVRAEVDHRGDPLARGRPAREDGERRVGDPLRGLRHRGRC